MSDQKDTASTCMRARLHLACFARHYGGPWPHFHWAFPRRLSKELRWLAVYVALSRVRRLKSLRSIGLNRDIRSFIESGPPDSLPAQFDRLFKDKETKTLLDAKAAMTALGWSGCE